MKNGDDVATLSSCTFGTKGHLRVSGREFIITARTSLTSTTRYRGERTEVEVADKELRGLADDGWSDEGK